MYYFTYYYFAMSHSRARASHIHVCERIVSDRNDSTTPRLREAMEHSNYSRKNVTPRGVLVQFGARRCVATRVHRKFRIAITWKA